MPDRTYTLTYDVVTPESAELGDFADHGYGSSADDGTSLRRNIPDPGDAWTTYVNAAHGAATDWIALDPDEVREDFAGDESACAVAMMVRLLRSHYGATEPSSHPWTPGTWYRQPDGSIDYSDGSVTRTNVHLSGFTKEEERAIYAAVVRR